MDGNRDKPSLFRLCQLVVLLVWIVAFWVLQQRIWGSPLLGRFLRPDYWWLVEIGTAILVFFVIALVYCDPHDRGRRGAGLVMQMGIMIMPLLYLPTAVVSQLSPDGAKRRSFHVAQSGDSKNWMDRNGVFGSIANNGKPAGTYFKLPENPSLLRLVLEGEPYEGRQITTMGIAYWDDELPGNLFFCYQLLMFCCAADAKPIGVVVEYDKSKTLGKGGWVTVEGTVGFTIFKDRRWTKIIANKVTPTEPPGDPYLFP